MENGYLFIIALVLYSAAGTIILGLSAWQKQKAAGARMLSVLLLAISWWGLSYGAECLWPGLAGKLFWAKTKYFGVVLIPPAMLCFTAQYTRQELCRSIKPFLLMLIVPVFTLAAAWTNPWHHQFYTEAVLNLRTQPHLLDTAHGFFFWVHAAYSYLLLLAATIMLGQSVLHSARIYRRSQMMVLLALMFPLVGNVLNVFQLIPKMDIDPTPVAFMISGAAIYLAVFHFGLLDIAPIARRVVVDNMPDGILVLDPDARILDINPALAGQLGTTASQVIGRSLYEVLPDSVALLLAEAETSTENIEVEMVSGGQQRVFEVLSSPIRSEDGGQAPSRVLQLRDVTEHNRAAQSLWRVNELLERMYNNTDLLIVYLDQEFQILRVNRSFSSRVQTEPEEIIGRRLFDLFPNTQREGIFRQVMASGEAYSAFAEPYDETGVEAGRTSFWNWSLQPVRSAAGVVEGAVLSMFDVTERERASRALADALDLNQQIFSASAVGILAFDAGGACVLSNEAGARIFTGDQGDHPQVNFKMLPGWREAGLLKAGEDVLASGQPQRGEFQLIAPGGGKIWLECYLSRFASSGQPHLLLISHDITDRRLAEEELRSSELRFHSLVDSMNDLIFTLDADCRYNGVFGRFLTRPGMSEDFFLGRTAIDLLGEEGGKIHMEAGRRAQQGEEVVYEWKLDLADFTNVFQTSVSPMWQDGEVRGVVGVGRDITALKQLEGDLEQARALLEQAFHQSSAPMILLRSPDGIIEMINPACQERLMIDAPEMLLGQPIDSVQAEWEMHSSEGGVLPRELWPNSIVLQGGTLSNVEFMIRFPSGEQQWVLVSAAPVHNKLGAQIAALLIFVDITERKRIERAEREQRLLAETFRDTAAALNSAVQTDAVLNLVLTNIGRVVPHDAAHVLLFDENEQISRWRFSGYTNEEQNTLLAISQARVEKPGWSSAVVKQGGVIIADASRKVTLPNEVVFQRLRAFLDVPIQFKDRLVGVITLSSAQPGFFDETHAARLKVFADQAAVAIENARLYGEVQHLTLTDELTRLYNYRGLNELGQREFDRARRFDRPLSLLFFDVDHFRDFNNRYSHAVGNQVLQEVARIAQSCLRGVDLMARFGGEEFVALLPETDLQDAVQIAERIRYEVEATQVRTRFGLHTVTVSVGVAGLADDIPNLSALIEKANHAEHRAKQDGRNRVTSFPRSESRYYSQNDGPEAWSI